MLIHNLLFSVNFLLEKKHQPQPALLFAKLEAPENLYTLKAEVKVKKVEVKVKKVKVKKVKVKKVKVKKVEVEI